MIKANVETKGLEKDLARVSGKLRDALEAALHDAAVDVRDTAQDLVPRDTGALHDGIVVVQNGLSAKVGVFDPDLYYGLFIEFGTSSLPSKPFMTPGAEKVRSTLERTFIKAVKRGKF